VGGGGGCSLLFMVVGSQHVFIVLIYCLRVLTAVHGGGHLTCLHRSFPSMMWPPTGRGGVMWRVLAANHQWAVNSGGAGLVGWVVIDVVGLLTISIQNNDIVVVVVPRQSALHGYHIAFILVIVIVPIFRTHDIIVPMISRYVLTMLKLNVQ